MPCERDRPDAVLGVASHDARVLLVFDSVFATFRRVVSSGGMYQRVNQRCNGTLFCGMCLVDLTREEKVTGIAGGHSYDVYRCPRCLRLQWLPDGRPRSGHRYLTSDDVRCH